MHTITGLDTGGAEMSLLRLLAGIDRERFPSTVISLLPPGPVAGEISRLGVEVRSLGMTRSVPSLRAQLRLRKWLKSLGPHVVQSWLYHADLMCTVAAMPGASWASAWNIRCAEVNMGAYRPATALVRRLLARLSARPDAVVANSHAGRSAHEALGYRPGRFEVIPNGFDVGTFRPDPETGAAMRNALGIARDALVICLPARWDPVKDHRTFIRAAQAFQQVEPKAAFVLVGKDLGPEDAGIRGLLRAHPINDVYLLGERRDMPRIYAMCDIVVSASAFAEAFPNVLGEAMACAVCCVITNIGDGPMVVADTGRVIPPGDPQALCEAWKSLRDPGLRAELGARARQRVADHFSLEHVVIRYETLYRELARARLEAI